MTYLQITTKVSKTSAGADAGVSVASITPLDTWTLFLKVWSFNTTSGSDLGTERARINWEDSANAFGGGDTLQGPVHCIVPLTGVPEGRIYSTRWRDFDDLRIGVSSCQLRTNLTRITGSSTIVYEAWLTY